MSYDDAIAKLETLVAQQAAVIEQMREAMKVLRLKTDPKYGWPIINKALALQPCPEVMNKVRADARRQALHDAADDFEIGASADDIRCNAQHIEQGEA